MRTTVEISDRQHHRLIELATKRGLRGFSPLVQEAIDEYLKAQDDQRVSRALAAEGSLSDDEAALMQQRIEEAWQTWAT